MDIHQLHAGSAAATVAAEGAELRSLRLGGRELLWDGGPLWPRCAPLLFPIVGQVKGNAFRHGGRDYSLPRHGFARDRTFAWIRREDAACGLELRDDEETRAAYPFAFALGVDWTLEERALRMDIVLHNPGSDPLPASLGLHPAFRWPLAPDTPKAAHRLVFEAEEPALVHRLTPEGLLDPAPRPSPVRGRALPLDESLFADDALIFDQLRSRALRFEAEGGSVLELRWEGFSQLGLWSKPDPDPAFLCIEPWDGYADPADWEGEFADKPGGFILPAGAVRRWSLTISAGA
ncbi:aldose 1-epimerase family protein [Geothrix sp. 21YS21S-4]|uniref:aldose 1-epimerase family protein n=1 Tax=Geothrix sp. 21YS21S-4 TaxID=3068889 RepID=UPI0027BA42F8|nr:aldose 1-epimerase family protein [Geothrix sp. 21YS21S-4]